MFNKVDGKINYKVYGKILYIKNNARVCEYHLNNKFKLF